MARKMNHDEKGFYVRWDEETCIHTLYGVWFTMEVIQVTFVDIYDDKGYLFYGKLYDFKGEFCGYTKYYHDREGFFQLEKDFRQLMIVKNISK